MDENMQDKIDRENEEVDIEPFEGEPDADLPRALEDGSQDNGDYPFEGDYSDDEEAPNE